MFSSSKNKSSRHSFSQGRVTKQPSKKQRSFREHNATRSIRASHYPVESSPDTSPYAGSIMDSTSPSLTRSSNLNSAIITLAVGRTQRLFAAHEDILCRSPYFQNLCRDQFFSSTKRINLADEEPEIFSSILEYLYKGDYYPKLDYDKKRQSWRLEDTDEQQSSSAENTVFCNRVGTHILKDTAIYCAATTYSLPELKRLALKKQGLQSGIQCSTILTSARYAYTFTPDTDSRLRAHYLALIIRSRNTFKRSGTMQAEMHKGGQLFFDLFVAVCNHLDDVQGIKSPR